VPISTAAYGTLRNEQIGNASGVFNLMRNVGGSIGISVAQTLLTRRSDVHQNEILNSVPQTGQQFQNAIGQAQHALTPAFGPANTLAPARAELYQQLGRQAAIWSFVDVFRWLSLLCFVCVAVVWTFKKVKPGKAPAGAH
jgi:DHA2 family multidrug resistance protein